MKGLLACVAFDADDTLWHNERFFRLTQTRFAELLADHADPDHLEARLLEAERRNLGRYGFGVKAFVLSMIETALDVTDRTVPAPVIAELIAAGKDMLAHPIELLPGVEETVTALAGDFRLLVITKGDLLDQERKVAQSGLGDLFDGVEIVSDKTPETYRRVFHRHGCDPGAALMAGNSVKSDVVPMIATGGWAVHVPHADTWALEEAALPTTERRFLQVERIGEIVALCREIAATGGIAR
jgi:putative hydrolase of the HAD superfamily